MEYPCSILIRIFRYYFFQSTVENNSYNVEMALRVWEFTRKEYGHLFSEACIKRTDRSVKLYANVLKKTSNRRKAWYNILRRFAIEVDREYKEGIKVTRPLYLQALEGYDKDISSEAYRFIGE